MSETKSDTFFDKAVFGGYDKEQVDAFVEEARKMLSWQKKENEVLKQKMQILADALRTFQESAASAPSAPESAEQPKAEAVIPEKMPEISANEGESKINELTSQISQAQETLQALKVEKAAFLAAVVSQYEVCLRQYESCIAVMQGLPDAPAESVEIAAPIAPEVPAADPVSRDSEEDAEAEPTPVVQNTQSLVEEQTEPVVPEPAEETQKTVDAIAETITGEPDPVTEEPAPVEEPIPSIAETVPVGDSVYLQADGDIGNLSYEEALALVLRKNGIIQKPSEKKAETPSVNAAPSETDGSTIVMPAIPVRKADEDSEQPTKVVPKITVQPSAPTKNELKPDRKTEKIAEKKTEKKRSFFRSLKDNIRAFIDDEDMNAEDDNVSLLQKQTEEESENSLRFGKAHDVKKGR